MAKVLELFELVSKCNFPDEDGNPHWYFIFDNDKEQKINNSFFEMFEEEETECQFKGVKVSSHEELNTEYKKHKKVVSREKAAPVVKAARKYVKDI